MSFVYRSLLEVLHCIFDAVSRTTRLPLHLLFRLRTWLGRVLSWAQVQSTRKLLSTTPDKSVSSSTELSWAHRNNDHTNVPIYASMLPNTLRNPFAIYNTLQHGSASGSQPDVPSPVMTSMIPTPLYTGRNPSLCSQDIGLSPMPVDNSATSPASVTDTSSAHGRVSPALSRDLAVPARSIYAPSSREKGILYPIFPKYLERYDRNAAVKQSSEPSEYTIQPLTLEFERTDVPPEWTAYTHPEGCIYFQHNDKKIITDAYLCDKVTLAKMEGFIDQMEELKAQHIDQLPADADLVMELVKADDSDEILCGYYFVHHAERTLFWLEDFDIFYILWGVGGAQHPSHIKHIMESQYWSHVEYFPDTLTLSTDIVDELNDIIMASIADSLTSSLSTVPYSMDDLSNMLGLTRKVEERDLERSRIKYFIGRFMTNFTHTRFLDFYGQEGARLSRNQRLHGDVKPRSLFVTLLSPLLFYAPEVHMRTLDSIYIDEVISKIPWGRFIDKLNSEWQELTLTATVILNANVAFLAIPSVDADSQSQSLSQIASYISVATSIGSIVMGLLLVRQNRTKGRDTVDDAVNFFQKVSDSFLGLGTIAIIFSLPYAFLMWSTIAFLAAFLGLSLGHTVDLTRILVGIVWFLIAVPLLWCIWSAWENRPSSGKPLRAKILERAKIWKPIRAKFVSMKSKSDSEAKVTHNIWRCFPPRTPSESDSATIC